MTTPMNKKDINFTHYMHLRTTNSTNIKSYSSHIFTINKSSQKTKTKIAKRIFYPQSSLFVNLERH